MDSVAWELDLGEDRRRRDAVIVLSVLTLFAVLIGVTILGIVENWPRHRSIAAAQQFQRPKNYDAKVVGLRSVRCQAPTARNCSIVTVKLESGPDKGTRSSF
ncbi:MAG: hypothetical protein QOG80_1797, partial [Pseudonocardiales bacterium]|nr:hypothetical protein [Pseudonocardiales bacterium]